MRSAWLLLALLSLFETAGLWAAGTGSRVSYMGGTVTGVSAHASGSIDLIADEVVFTTSKGIIRINCRDVNNLEYGMKVNRRYLEALLISPIFLIAKKKTHYLTIGYTDTAGQQQAMVLQVGKDQIRPLLASLEARTGRRVEFQDDEARKAGRG